VPNEPDSVVEVSPPEREEFVPQARPRAEEFSPPVAVIFPFNVAPLTLTFVAAFVFTVGAETGHAEVINEFEIGAVLVPALFTAYGR